MAPAVTPPLPRVMAPAVTPPLPRVMAPAVTRQGGGSASRTPSSLKPIKLLEIDQP